MSFELNRALTPLINAKSFKYGTWDIEASDWWNLKLIGVFDGERYFHFQEIGDFLSHILQHKYRDFRWFAHFGGRYDMNFIFDYVRERGGVGVSFYCSGSMVMQMTIRSKDHLAKLCDSFRLLPAALRELGIAFNVDHKKTVIDFDNLEYGTTLIEYNEQDCRCLYECLERFFEETGMQSETFATHSLRVFRKDFLKQSIWKPKPEVADFVRRGYHGGRVEVFKRENENLNAYDVNSMYPHVMRAPMPVEFIGESTKLLDGGYGFVDASVRVPETYIPCLPYRMVKLYFPVGNLRAVWSAEELRAAESRGAVIDKIHQAYYFKCEEIFEAFVMKLYALKKNAGEPSRTIAKFLLNSFYGKFGQNPTKKVYCTEIEAPDGSYPILRPDGNPSGFAYYERTSQAAYLLPHLAAAVTSKARLHLLTSLSDASYYCDTDSIFTTGKIRTGSDLGQWSLVGSGACQFYQPKLYKFKGTWKAKGLNRQESIDDYVTGAFNNVSRTKSIKEALRDGTAATQHVQVSKRLQESQPKRAWLGGQDTRPWNIEEIR